MAEAEKQENEEVKAEAAAEAEAPATAETEAEAQMEAAPVEAAAATEEAQAEEAPATATEDAAIAATAAVAASASKGSGRGRWYIVHAYSGFEHKIKQQIMEKAAQNGISDQIEDIVVPTENVMEVRRGKKVEAEKKFFPGYLLIKMQLTDEAWHMVKNTDKVTGFLGAGGKPQRVPQSEVDAIFQQMEEGVTAGTRGIIYEIGEQVKVTDGPFDSFTGTVEEVDEEREKIKVSVSIFGRSTPVELDYTQVQKT